MTNKDSEWEKTMLSKKPCIEVEKMKKLTELVAETYEKKNHDYGNSFADSVKKYGIEAGLARLHDKFSRVENLLCNGKQNVKDESVKDTLIDLATYSLMLRICIDDDKCSDDPNKSFDSQKYLQTIYYSFYQYRYEVGLDPETSKDFIRELVDAFSKFYGMCLNFVRESPVMIFENYDPDSSCFSLCIHTKNSDISDFLNYLCKKYSASFKIIERKKLD